MVTPVNVVSTAYLVSQMGRPQRLSNGWLVGGVYDTTNGRIRFYKSTDSGNTWSILTYVNVTATGNFALASKGTMVYCLFASSGGSVSPYLCAFDAATVTNTAQPTTNPDSNQTVFSGCDLGITPDGSFLWWTASSKNPTYPNSFNIRAANIPINADGTLGTPGSVHQIYTVNIGNYDHKNPVISFMDDGNPFIVSQYNQQTGVYAIEYAKFDGTSWTKRLSDILGGSNSSYLQQNPTICKTPNGKVHVAWDGYDSTDTTNLYVRYNVSADFVTWPTPKKLVKGTNATITSDKNGKLFITYEDAGVIKRIESTDEFATWTAPVTVETGTKPSSFYDPSFSTNFSIPPTLYQTSTAVRYYGELNNPPSLSLTNPADNHTLFEGNAFNVQGSATDADANNVVTIKYKINNGTTFNAGSGVSDGTTAISFAKNLTYSNKRLRDGATDVTGVDLAENTNHTLTVWAEDDQGGISNQVTRTFTVIWNRPPTISGADTNLGMINTPPTFNYSVTDPEAHAFTINEYLNGVQTKTFAGVAEQNYSITIDQNTWLRLALGVPHTVKVRATDSNGLYSERIFTFTRTETQIVFTLKNPFLCDAKPSRVLVTLDAVIPTGATKLVEVCNNAFDAAPTWEDVTSAVSAGRGYVFTNASKTAANWGINIRFTFNKGTAVDPVLINGFGGAYD